MDETSEQQVRRLKRQQYEFYDYCYSLLDDFSKGDPQLVGWDEVVRGYQATTDVRLSKFQIQEVVEWLCRSFFTHVVVLREDLSAEEGAKFVRTFCKKSALRSQLGDAFFFDDPDDALHFKLKYY